MNRYILGRTSHHCEEMIIWLIYHHMSRGEEPTVILVSVQPQASSDAACSVNPWPNEKEKKQREN